MLRLAALSCLLTLLLALACDNGTPGPASVRIAQFIPDAVDALDICLRPDGTATFSGKFVQQGGLGFASTSARASVDAGTYALRIVAASASDCSTSYQGLGDIGNIQIAADFPQTVALMGRLAGTGAGGVGVRTYTDNLTAPPSPGVNLRFAHASPELGSVDVGSVSGNTFLPLNPAVTLTYPSESPYTSYTGGVSNATIGLLDTGTTNLRLSGSFSVAGGTSATVFIVGRPSQTSGDSRLSFLRCPEASNDCQRFP